MKPTQRMTHTTGLVEKAIETVITTTVHMSKKLDERLNMVGRDMEDPDESHSVFYEKPILWD